MHLGSLSLLLVVCAARRVTQSPFYLDDPLLVDILGTDSYYPDNGCYAGRTAEGQRLIFSFGIPSDSVTTIALGDRVCRDVPVVITRNEATLSVTIQVPTSPCLSELAGDLFPMRILWMDLRNYFISVEAGLRLEPISSCAELDALVNFSTPASTSTVQELATSSVTMEPTITHMYNSNSVASTATPTVTTAGEAVKQNMRGNSAGSSYNVGFLLLSLATIWIVAF